jgi:uncharacterized ferritin-like protein (DUF455 family)
VKIPNFVQPEHYIKKQSNPLLEPSVFKKVEVLLKSCPHDLLLMDPNVPSLPGRDIEVRARRDHPPKVGLSKAEGKARLLHDLASIELQAMELGLRTLFDFPEAATSFREELAGIAIGEARHLNMCLIEIEALGFKWGDWPVHLSLWEATSHQDSLLDRILIVHRYLEGSGLDAGDTLLRRLNGLAPEIAHRGIENAVRIITEEEIGHVEFGSRFYRQFCLEAGLDASDDFSKRMEKLRWVLPRRMEPINRDLRRQAGFEDFEIDYLEKFRSRFFESASKEQ